MIRGTKLYLDVDFASILEHKLPLFLQVLVKGRRSMYPGGLPGRFHPASSVYCVTKETVSWHLQTHHPCCAGTRMQPDPIGEYPLRVRC